MFAQQTHNLKRTRKFMGRHGCYMNVLCIANLGDVSTGLVVILKINKYSAFISVSVIYTA